MNHTTRTGVAASRTRAARFLIADGVLTYSFSSVGGSAPMGACPHSQPWLAQLDGATGRQRRRAGRGSLAPSFLYLLLVPFLLLVVWAVMDALIRPDSEWRAAEQNKIAWVIALL